MADSLGPRGPFYREAVAQVAADFPESTPDFDPGGFKRLVYLQQKEMQASQEAYDLRERLGRCEMANLALGQALGMAEVGSRVAQLIKSAMTELRLAEIGAPNPDELDSGPTASFLLEARGHLEISQSISGPARPGIEIATELIDLAMQDLAQLTLRMEQIKNGRG